MQRRKKNKQAGEEFKKLLQEKGFTQYKLEQTTGLDKSVISKIVNGYTASPTTATLEKIANALEIELGQLASIFVQTSERSHSEPPPPPQQPKPGQTVSKNTDFVGREKAIADLDNLVNEGKKVILIQAEGGIGKTTLARKWFELRDLEYLELRVGTTPQNLNSVEDWVRQKLRDHFNEIPEQNFSTMLEQLKDQLQTQQIGILIDNLEPALIKGNFFESHRRYYVELLTVLAHPSVQSLTLITSRERLHESAVKSCKLYQLDGLELETWQQYFETCKISIDVDDLIEMRRAYGGNAEAMSLLGAEILKESKGDLKAYWQENRDDLLRNPTLEDLVQRQFDKLKNDNLQAYKLLCRVGYYPDRDVDFVPKIWLYCLLWDVPERRQRVVDALCDRSLVKVSDEEYYLHPVIRSKAIESLQSIEEPNAEKLLSIKKQIDTLLASDKKLHHLLAWICHRVPSIDPVDKPAIRAFYYAFWLKHIHNLAIVIAHTGDALELDFQSFIELVCAVSESRKKFKFFKFLRLAIALDSDLAYATERHLICATDLKLALELQQLLPPQEGELAWWKANSQAWAEKLKSATLKCREIGLEYQFTQKQWLLLQHFCDVNKLLVDCLKSTSNEVRSRIEDELFLPISEIQKRKQSD